MKSTENGSGAKLETRVRRVPISRLEHLPGNPRYMTSAQFERLTKNIASDGVLTSLPLVYDLAGDDSGKLLILSGNQRVDGAAAAGLTEIDVLEIVTRISDERRRAIALSHNAITGQDDPNALRAFYETLSLALKEYSGLTEDHFKAAAIDLGALSLRPPVLEQINMTFLPENAELFKKQLKRIEKRGQGTTELFARFDDFTAFFDTMTRTQQLSNVHNAAMALCIMAELAGKQLDLMEAAAEAAEHERETEVPA